LDEATSALDSESERLVQQAIGDLAHQCTLLVIAHRLSTVRHADVIVVMEAGKIVEQGSYDELVASQGIFARLISQQLSA
jgi:ABC-type multidrug transport system fused ATPase/permease subunit